MSATDGLVRPGRSRRGSEAGLRIAVTGAAGGVGAAVAARLVGRPGVRTVLGLDTTTVTLPGVTFRRADVLDPGLPAALKGVDVVVHLAQVLHDGADPATRRAVNVRGTATVLTAAQAAGTRRLVLLSSAAVLGAHPDNPVPLPEDHPVSAAADDSLVGDLVEVERLVASTRAAYPALALTLLRAAPVVGPGLDEPLLRHLTASRLLLVRGTRPLWQFVHVDDLADALVLAALGAVTGDVGVGAPGWLEPAQVLAVTRQRRLELPAAVAFGAAERLRRLGVTSGPEGELAYLSHPWVVDPSRLLAAGWSPAVDNQGALRAHLDAVPAGGASRTGRAAAGAGATVALVGTAALVRRARRRQG